MPDERILGLQVEDVELVDAGRHHQQRALVHLGRERLVFDELEKRVLVHHGALGGGHVAAHLEDAFVGHGHMALPHVVQQVGDALGQALALGIDGLLLRLGVEDEEIAGCHGRHPLLHAEADARACLGIGLHRVGQSHQGARVEQVGRGGEGCHGALGPCGGAEAAVFHGGRLQRLAPELGRFLQVLLLQPGQLVRGEGNGRTGLRGSGAGSGRAASLSEGFQRLHPAFAQFLLDLPGIAGPACVKIHERVSSHPAIMPSRQRFRRESRHGHGIVAERYVRKQCHFRFFTI